MQKYSITMRLFHWTTALLVFGLFGAGLWMRNLGYYDPLYQVLPYWHKSVGFLLTGLILLRLLNRWFSAPPMPLASHRAWEQRLAHLMHWMLYLLLFGLFISGYLVATSDNRPASFFDWFDIPVLFTAVENQEDVAGLIHEVCAWSLIGLVGLHALAAFKHHWLDRDQTLRRML